MWPELRLQADGTLCLHVGNRQGDPNSALALYMEDRARTLMSSYPLCADSQAAPQPSPAAAAYQLWRDQMQLPRPEPSIAPGKAITGKPAFLEIRGARSRAQQFNVFGYDLTIAATTNTYDIDWGDGTWTRGVTSTGGPWPDGDVRHVYTDQGTYTVRVFAHWTGVWSLAQGPANTPVPGELRTEGRIDDFPVVQLQAVRNR